MLLNACSNASKSIFNAVKRILKGIQRAFKCLLISKISSHLLKIQTDSQTARHPQKTIHE